MATSSNGPHVVCQDLNSLSPEAIYELSFDYGNLAVGECLFLALYNGERILKDTVFGVVTKKHFFTKVTAIEGINRFCITATNN